MSISHVVLPVAAQGVLRRCVGAPSRVYTCNSRRLARAGGSHASRLHASQLQVDVDASAIQQGHTARASASFQNQPARKGFVEGVPPLRTSTNWGKRTLGEAQEQCNVLATTRNPRSGTMSKGLARLNIQHQVRYKKCKKARHRGTYTPRGAG